jgi:hypothetical protein
MGPARGSRKPGYLRAGGPSSIAHPAGHPPVAQPIPHGWDQIPGTTDAVGPLRCAPDPAAALRYGRGGYFQKPKFADDKAEGLKDVEAAPGARP